VARRFFYILTFVISITGCSIFVKAPVQEVKGDSVVCVLFNDSRFKTKVVENLRGSLAGRGYKIVTDRIKWAK